MKIIKTTQVATLTVAGTFPVYAFEDEETCYDIEPKNMNKKHLEKNLVNRETFVLVNDTTFQGKSHKSTASKKSTVQKLIV